MTLLDGEHALSTARDLIARSASAKLAVAFWGKGAVKRLGLDREGLNLTVICNLESGACNPAEIRSLLALGPSVKVFSDPQLHAKVYWTPDAAVVGSSNASTNGLAVETEGEAGWAEANVLVADARTVADIEEWFKNRNDAALPVTEEAIRRIEEVWKLRRRSAPPGVRVPEDLIEAWKSVPEHPAWQAVRICIWTKDIDQTAMEVAETAAREGMVPEDWDAYQGWTARLRDGDWLIDLDLSGAKASSSGLFFTGEPKHEIGDLTFVRKVSRAHLPGWPPLTLSKTSAQMLTLAGQRLLDRFGDGEGAVVPLSEALRFLGSNDQAVETATVDVDRLRATLLNTYDEASALGYRPTNFRTMVLRDAVDAARRLLDAPRQPPGLGRLAELGRLDLSVEDISLRPEWRSLFTDRQLETAARRLGRCP